MLCVGHVLLYYPRTTHSLMMFWREGRWDISKISLVVNERRLDKINGKKDEANGRKTKVSFYQVKAKLVDLKPHRKG